MLPFSYLAITTPGTYTVWLRGYPSNSAGDSVYVGLGEERVEVSGFAPQAWDWTNLSLSGSSSSLPVGSSGVYTLNMWMREDGLRIDRLLLTTDTNYIPADFGLVETTRVTEASTSTGSIHTENGVDSLGRAGESLKGLLIC